MGQTNRDDEFVSREEIERLVQSELGIPGKEEGQEEDQDRYTKKGKLRKSPKLGREISDFDLGQVALCGRFAVTNEEMASIFGVSTATVSRRMNDENSLFCKTYKKARAETLRGLRSAQIHVALKGNPTMLIWLGKQLLGQTDRQVLEHHGDQPETTMTTLDDFSDELRDMFAAEYIEKVRREREAAESEGMEGDL